jgi:uncharacterized protein (TIGR03083 family)
MGTDVDYLAHLASESARFAEVMHQVQPTAPVPSCPDWNADDLLWHLAEVQWFWATVVREKLTGSQVDQRTPERPSGRAALFAFFERASHDLGEILAATPPEAPAWTWSQAQTVGFIRRRQAHEALIHRIDAELTADDRTSMDPKLSADGVDEALRVMYGGTPEWGRFEPERARTLRLRTSDTGDSWLVTLGLFVGTDPADGTAYREPDINAAGSDPGTPAMAAISGYAGDLDCWLWHRPPVGPVELSGDQDVLGRFESTIAPGIN